MKICHIITTLHFGGADRLLADLTAVQAKDHPVDIIYLKGEPKLKSFVDSSIKVHHIPLDKNCAKNIRAFLKTSKPDILHTHLGHADFLGLWAARGLKVTRFCTMHNVWFKWDWRDYVIFAGYYLLFKFIALSCHVICVSKSVAEHVERRLGVKKKQVDVIYNAIPTISLNLTKAQLRSKLDIPQESFCVLFVGRLRIQKSVDTLLKAVTRIKPRIQNLLVIIIGEGHKRDQLVNLSAELGLSTIVQFRDVTPSPELYFAAADLFVLPSVFEGFGIVVLEAFRASLPVIATNIEGPRELIHDGFNGLLYTPKNDEQLAEKMIRLYEDEDLRKNIGHKAYESYVGEFTMEKYVAKIEKLYLSKFLESLLSS